MKTVFFLICSFCMTLSQAFSQVERPISEAKNSHTSPMRLSQKPIKRVKKVLVFAPHPDDDVIGCGGSIAKHTKKGHEVCVVYMTSGDASGSSQYCNELALTREKEASNAANLLGVKNLHFLRNPDGFLTYDFKSICAVVDVIRQEQPDLVYIPHHADAHKDHIITHEIVVEAIKRAPWANYQVGKWEPWRVRTILCYEVWTPLQEVSYIEDISEFMELKLQALRQHLSQIQVVRYDFAVEGLNRYRGSLARSGLYAEGFQLFKINREDLENLIQN